MHWSEFLDTAERLAQGTTEGDWRSAVSRCYYAAFHFFREFLLANGLNVGQGGQSHHNLYSGLFNCGFAPVATLASRFDDLRTKRVLADYQLGRPFPHSLAQSRVREARTLIADFQTLLGSLSSTGIAAGARRYLQTIGRLGKTP